MTISNTDTLRYSTSVGERAPRVHPGLDRAEAGALTVRLSPYSTTRFLTVTHAVTPEVHCSMPDAECPLPVVQLHRAREETRL